MTLMMQNDTRSLPPPSELEMTINKPSDIDWIHTVPYEPREYEPYHCEECGNLIANPDTVFCMVCGAPQFDDDPPDAGIEQCWD